jgi:hypothetical protein
MENVITIVSGLPRSGTSMMMRMLDAGGMPVVVDHVRKPDEDNPVGYFEFEKVKKIKEDSSWLNGVQGKVVKMVSQLLYDLPSSYRYKVIFMRRNMQETLKSQQKMLERKGTQDNIADEDMLRFFQKHVADVEEWLRKQPNIDVLYVDYNETMKNPANSAHAINTFLGGALDPGKMATAVDKSLYRNRRPA